MPLHFNIVITDSKSRSPSSSDRPLRRPLPHGAPRRGDVRLPCRSKSVPRGKHCCRGWCGYSHTGRSYCPIKLIKILLQTTGATQPDRGSTLTEAPELQVAIKYTSTMNYYGLQPPISPTSKPCSRFSIQENGRSSFFRRICLSDRQGSQ